MLPEAQMPSSLHEMSGLAGPHHPVPLHQHQVLTEPTQAHLTSVRAQNSPGLLQLGIGMTVRCLVHLPADYAVAFAAMGASVQSNFPPRIFRFILQSGLPEDIRRVKDIHQQHL